MQWKEADASFSQCDEIPAALDNLSNLINLFKIANTNVKKWNALYFLTIMQTTFFRAERFFFFFFMNVFYLEIFYRLSKRNSNTYHPNKAKNLIRKCCKNA